MPFRKVPRVMGPPEALRQRRDALREDVRAGRVKKVLAVRFGRLGDVLFTTPALANVAEALAGVQIDYLTSAPGEALVSAHPAVSEVLRFAAGAQRVTWSARRRALRREIQRRGYDLALVFESDHPTRYWLETLFAEAGVRHVVSRSSFVREGSAGADTPEHSCERHEELLTMLGLEPTRRSYALFVTPEETERAERFLHERGVAREGDRPARLVGFQAGCHYSMWPGAKLLPGLRHKFHKTWPEAHWQELGRLLGDRLGARVLLFGSGNERRIAERIARGIDAPADREPIVTAGETSVALLAALLRRMDLVVSVDTGTMHMAAALGVPTLALFGPTNPGHHGPYRRAETCRVLRSGVACSPCAKPVRRRCPANVCMRELTAPQVAEAGLSLLGPAAGPDQSRRAVRERSGR